MNILPFSPENEAIMLKRAENIQDIESLISAIREYKKIMEDFYSIELAEPEVTKTLNEALALFNDDVSQPKVKP